MMKFEMRTAGKVVTIAGYTLEVLSATHANQRFNHVFEKVLILLTASLALDMIKPTSLE